MSQTGRFRVSCFLLFGGLLLLAPTLRAQDLRQWMPNVGDQFVYDQVRTYWPPNTLHDTLRVVVDSVDVSGDSLHRHLVYVQGQAAPYANYLFSGFPYAFSDGDSTGSQFPFVISVRRTVISNKLDDTARYDFSKGLLEQYQYGNSTITVPRVGTILHGHAFAGDADQYRNTLWYSKELKWFVRDEGTWDETSDDLAVSWGRQLISAWNLAVNSSQPSSNSVIRISQSNGLLAIDLGLTSSSKTSVQLLDLLGRPVRAWTMEVAAGESRITLNVADVPSGVYFLKLTAPGVEEVRRVCIAH